MTSDDWLALLLPARRNLGHSCTSMSTGFNGDVNLLSRVRAELVEDLRMAGLPLLFLSSLPVSFPSYPRLELLIEPGMKTDYYRALIQTVEPGAGYGTHMSGLRVYFHSSLPGGPEFSSVITRSSIQDDGTNLADPVDRLWMSGILSMMDRSTNRHGETASLLRDFDSSDWVTLMSRDCAVARFAIWSVACSLRIELPNPVQAWLAGAIDRLSEDLILHGMKTEIGLKHIRAFVGWPTYLRHRYLPSKRYREFRQKADF